ncbi:hypothetical protein BOTBODRAFT_173915 [Botryobasidium botryosum FD-172 SS1]|uniref:Uncharacterized protein n=1 Tax=Botryobasidium botryosum (strain FD-172 SS1) TaxID=930990 RepID=A0A067MIT0_BOTB1|nr:hypothetical protein BOTBODRAFT_173915 [Botryobasidium botryosum FD-172 SS1]
MRKIKRVGSRSSPNHHQVATMAAYRPVQQLLLKTHTHTVVVPAPLTSTLADIKSAVYAALTQFSDISSAVSILGEDSFEVCRAGKSGGDYTLLEGDKKTVKEMGLANWEILYLRFRDADGELMPVQVTLPSLLGDDEDEEPVSSSKGKEVAR